VQISRGQLVEAERGLEDLRGLFTRTGNKDGVASATLNLGEVAFLRGELGKAELRFREGLDLGRKMDDAPNVEYASFRLGYVLVERGDLPGAEAAARDALASSERSGSAPAHAHAELVLAEIAEARGHPEEALRLRTAVRDRLKATTGASLQDLALATVALVRSLLDASPPRLAEASQLLGEVASSDDVRIESAVQRGRLLTFQGNPAGAIESWKGGLETARKLEPRRVPELERLIAKGSPRRP
jgi:tetratricopeptide (TPR) repeat protein